MSLTTSEEQRIADIEENLAKLFRLLDGSASKNMLNRLHVLNQNEVNKLETRMTSIETDLTTLTELAQSLQ